MQVDEQAAREIINIFAEKECSVGEAIEILKYVGGVIGKYTTIQEVAGALYEC